MASAAKVELGLQVNTAQVRKYTKAAKQIQEANKGISESSKKMAKQSQETANKMGNTFKKATAGAAAFKKGFGDAIKQFGPAAAAFTIITASLLAMGNGIDFVREKTIEFEKTMSSVQAILQPTAGQFRTLNEEAKKLGETTAFSASEAGQAFVELGKLGLTTNQILASSADVLNIAAAAQIDLASAAELTAITLKQFGLQADEAQRVTDVMSKSFTSSALDAEKFRESMKLAGPVAANLGSTIETASAAIAELANAGISGSMAGTSLRRVMLELAAYHGQAAPLLGKANFATLSFTEKLQELQSKNLSPTTIKNTFGLLASTSAGILIKGAENVEKFDKTFQSANGSAKAMADTMLNNVAGATKILESAQEGLALAIGEAFGEAKRKRIEFYTKTINFATSFVSAHKDALKLVANFLSDTFLASLNIVITAWRGWISLMELSVGALLKVGQGLVEAAIIAKKFAATISGTTADVSHLEDVSRGLGAEAALAFERAREAAEGFKLSKNIGETKELKTELEKLKPAILDLSLDDNDFDFSTPKKAKKAAKIPGAKTVDFQKAQQDAIAAGEKLKEIAAQTNSDLQLELLSGKEKELEMLRRFEEEKQLLLFAGGENAVLLDEVVEQRRTEIAKKHAQERMEIAKQAANVVLSGAAGLTSALGNLASVQGENELKKAEAAGASEEKLEAIRKKTFEKQKKFQLASSGIALGAGIVNALSIQPANLVPFAVAFAAATGAANIAAISAQEFATGGVVQGGSFSGDNIPILANSGERILTATQNTSLDRFFDGKGGGGGNQITFEAPIIQVANGDPVAIASAVKETMQEQIDTFARTQREASVHEVLA